MRTKAKRGFVPWFIFLSTRTTWKPAISLVIGHSFHWRLCEQRKRTCDVYFFCVKPITYSRSFQKPTRALGSAGSRNFSAVFFNKLNSLVVLSFIIRVYDSVTGHFSPSTAKALNLAHMQLGNACARRCRTSPPQKKRGNRSEKMRNVLFAFTRRTQIHSIHSFCSGELRFWQW